MLQTFKPCGMGRALPTRQPISIGLIAARRVRCNGSVQPASTAAATTVPAAAAPVEQAVAAMDAAADSTAMYTPPPMDPRMYQQLLLLQQQQMQQQQQQQSGAYRPQDYQYQQYQGMPPAAYYPPAPPASYKAEEAGSGVPWFIFVGVGILAAQVLAKVQEYMKNPKTPQQMMSEMMMNQMKASMGGAAGAPSPWGAPGAPGGSPFPMPPGGMPFPGANNPFAGKGFPTPPSAATVDATAWPIPTPQPPQQQQQSNGYPTSSQSAPAQKLDVVNPVVKEPSSSSSNSSREAPKAAFFTDATDSSTSSSATGSSSGSPMPTMPPIQFPNTPGTGATPSAEEASVMGNMMENMLRNPEMQKMIYPYLPEPMRNPASVEWMLSQPEVKKQMETLFAQQQGSMSPEMMGMMKGMDYNQDKVNRQFEELGLKPEDVIGKVMANPELAAGFQNPKVQAAIIDISANPMNVVKYQNDPEIMKVLEKVTEIFQPNVPPAQRQ